MLACTGFHGGLKPKAFIAMRWHSCHARLRPFALHVRYEQMSSMYSQMTHMHLELLLWLSSPERLRTQCNCTGSVTERALISRPACAFACSALRRSHATNCNHDWPKSNFQIIVFLHRGLAAMPFWLKHAVLKAYRVDHLDLFNEGSSVKHTSLASSCFFASAAWSRSSCSCACLDCSLLACTSFTCPCTD